MRPELKSRLMLGVTRSKAKMLEYGVPEEHHINITQDPAKLFTIAIGLLGDLAAELNREEFGPAVISDVRNELLFSARFFDAYLLSELNEALDAYVLLLGAASYYLCDLPGSASVLAKRISGECPDLEGDGLEDLLLWLLQADLNNDFEASAGPYGEYIVGISGEFRRFFETGTGEANLKSLVTNLRSTVYESGTPRQLLLGDVVAAVVKTKLHNSSWNALPNYSGLPREKWMEALRKESFIKELWPAQHLMGRADVLKGQSAIVQMPTSAGKTKATELVLRSAFLAERTSLAIIIAPFRALCHEIKNSLVEGFRNEPIKIDELSDTMQFDFQIAELLGHQQILVVTPEKLLYVLRQVPELASHAGVLVFDEGHQFDSGSRGIAYELLLTSLRSMLSQRTQKVLISAVISNAEAVGEWLNGHPNVVEGTNLNPTLRSVGFASWLDQLGRIEYVDNQDPETREYFVPRVIERFNLGKRGKERIDRFFPDKSDGQAVALYLGLKLTPRGGVAIFCGRKSTAANVCEMAVEYIERGLPLTLPLEFSDEAEIARLTNLHVANLGPDAPAAKSATHGIFSHHGNTPHGIRLAVEYAMREDLVRFVVCTSTLAQGVNLPIRYLIVTTVYQGSERIKVRDFHNLIGRAGRAGMHTEGSILFADPSIYDRRKVRHEKWRWEQVKELLEPRNSEPCISNLLSLFEPIQSDDQKYTIKMEPLAFARAYVSDPDAVTRLAAEIADRHGGKGFFLAGVQRQVSWRIGLISAIESFLLSHWDEIDAGISDMEITRLAEGTLAFFLASDQDKEHIRQLFKLLAENISESVENSVRRKTYGRTLFGVQDAQAIEQWIDLNLPKLFASVDASDMLDTIWPLFKEHITNSTFRKLNKPEVLVEVANRWIGGEPFSELLATIVSREARMIWGSRRRDFKIDHVVEVCEGALAYDGALVVGAMCEFIKSLRDEGTAELLDRLQLFQKRLRYGLPTATTVALYELGFSDRVVAQDLAVSLRLSSTQKEELVRAFNRDRNAAADVMDKYPEYFRMRMSELLS